eukprot:CAMPEP_0117682066 /NCGR_PEP_ID=MMETSP0804-20121206/19398_1 /TAXON_ID=1074897 /ORGANISM="Tetraselmis astigmatica, Strain CCMP880" /LENGTH=104 /DNA_ID=CAMNT_0005492027 /DNA_START=156 /DNA_END=470 /DNA_ORIENTATION=-
MNNRAPAGDDHCNLRLEVQHVGDLVCAKQTSSSRSLGKSQDTMEWSVRSDFAVYDFVQRRVPASAALFPPGKVALLGAPSLWTLVPEVRQPWGRRHLVRRLQVN